MPKTKKVKAAGRFGVRYGRRVRVKTADIESHQRKKQHCMFCKGTAKRLSKGIWSCKKCGKKFTGHTYFLPKREE
ncbi:50S ribosomal protein L37ae [Candidatus Pacearchaeota archaeon]|nr:50S ribosomal protein L37ae [Candidatus Pacearchaeota archaeon]